MPIWSPKPSWASLTNGLLVLCGVLTAAQASVHTYAEKVSPMLGVPRSSSGTGTGTRAGDDLLSCISEMAPETTPVSPNLFDDSRIGTNFRYDSFHPILILNVSTVSVIQAAVVCAGKQGVTVIPMNGGHSFEGMSCTDGLLLHLDEFNDVVAVDESESGVLMTVEAGIRLARMYGLVIQYSDAQAAAGSESSYAVAGGTCPTVGVTGHTLCGGYGMLGRHVGLTSDQLVSIQLVTAGGDVVTATADNEHRDLFWAAKGGCSSAFGIVVSLTFRLLKLKSSAITTMDMLIPYNIPDVEGIAVWWQVWASREAIDTATSTIHLQSDGLRLQTVYIGSKADSEFANLVAEMAVGLKNFATADDIWASSIEGNFLDAVLWWSGDNDLNSVDDLLAVKSLDPLDTRSHSRRKSKSLLALGRPIPREGIKSIIDYEISGELNAVEWKVYGGVNPVTDTFYTDDRSPLLRGHLLEMHYGNSYGGEGSPEEDAQLVQDVDAIGETLSKYFAGTAGYIG